MSARDNWTPVRFVPGEVPCSFCLRKIPRGAPGSSKGTRGTKAYWCNSRKVWECIECRAEGVRAELAQDELDRTARRAVPALRGAKYDVVFNRHGGIESGLSVFVAAYHAGTLDALHVATSGAPA